MKRYKLLKDTPTLKAGTIFEEVVSDFDGLKGLARITPIGAKTAPQFTIKDIDNFNDWFEKIPEYKRWRAAEDEEYYAINRSGFVYRVKDTRQPEDDYRYKTGSYGRTKEELEAKLEYDIARQVLLDDAKGGKWKKNGANLYAYYDHDIDEWVPYNDIDNIQTIGAIYFQDEKDIKKSLKVHKEQWQIVRKYEMGEL